MIDHKPSNTERRRTEEAIDRLRHQNELILNAAGEGIYGLDLDGKITFVNPAAARMIEWRVEELIGKTMHDILHYSKPDGSPYPREECPIHAAFRDGTVYHVTDEVFWRKDGMCFPVEYISTPIRDDQGEVIGAVVKFKDITEQRQAEEKLRLQAQLLDSVRESIVATDLEGHVVYWGKGAEALYGYRADEVIGKPITFIVESHEEDEERRRIDAVRTRGLWCGQYWQRRKDGSKFWADTVISLVTDEKGQPCGFIGIDRDITERKRAEEALRESEERLRKIFEEGPLGMAIIDLDYRFVKVNGALCKMVGYTEQELTGLTFAEITHPEDIDKDVRLSEQIFGGEIPFFHLEKRYIKKDGGILWIGLTACVIRDEQGKPQYGLAMIEDITERKRAEEALRRLNEQLELGFQERTAKLSEAIGILEEQIDERHRAEEELLSSREQLRALSTRLLSVQEEERSRIAREIHDELGQALTGLKIDLTWVAQRLAPNQEHVKKKTDWMTHLIDTTVQTVRRISTELRPRILDHLGLVAALEWQIREFQDRTGIACMFTKHPEEITVHVERATTVFRICQEALTNVGRHAFATRIDLSLTKVGQDLVLEVRDNGTGITKEAVADPKSLGLIGMRERVLPMGGDVTIKGVRGKGTAVTVRIPIREGGASLVGEST
ncbi:MAG: PAS domain S-box protein [candidate division NC10 bacterium]|nr:PAS domain S-box protein [candidate division NC10 bacterium]